MLYRSGLVCPLNFEVPENFEWGAGLMVSYVNAMPAVTRYAPMVGYTGSLLRTLDFTLICSAQRTLYLQ